MNPRTVWTILRKELIETLRDKRTLITMIGLPILLYPVTILVGAQVAIMQATKMEETRSKVAVAREGGASLRDWVAEIPGVDAEIADDPQEDLAAGKTDAVVTAQGNLAEVLASAGTLPVLVEFDGTEAASREAMMRVVEGLRERADDIVAERIAAKGLEKTFAEPLKIDKKNVAPPQKATGFLLGTLLPYMLIFMLAMGAFYPAVDLTAGEKERGTFETLLSTPASKLDIVTGKFLAVFSISMTTGLLNLASMGASLLVLYIQIRGKYADNLAAVGLDTIQVSPMTIPVILGLLVPLAFLMSAVMMTVALFARDFKEAQNFLTPVLLLAMAPALASAFPSVELSPATMFIPILNVALLSKSLFMEEVHVQAVFSVFLSTSVYALLSLLAAVWAFQREDVILSEEKGFPLTLRRSAFAPRQTPTAGLSLGFFALAVLLFFYVGAYVQSQFLLGGIIITEWGLFLLPTILVLWYVHVDVRQTLSLKRPAWTSLLAALIMAPGLAVFAAQVFYWQNLVMPIPAEFMVEMEKLFQSDGSAKGFVLLLFAVAVSPAVCEEVLFRGAILSGLRTRLSPIAAVIAVSLLFGIIHASIYRVVVTGLLGVGITYAVLRSGSLFPGMLIHFFVNATAILVQSRRLPETVLSFLQDVDIENRGFPPWVLGSAVLVLALGVAVMELGARRRPGADG